MGERVPDSRPHEKRGGGLQGCDATRLKAGAKKKEAKKKTANHDNDRQARLPGTVCNRIERIATAAWPIGKKSRRVDIQGAQRELHKWPADCAQESGMTEMGRLDAAAGGVG